MPPSNPRRRLFGFLSFLLLSVSLMGCSKVETVMDAWRPETPYDQYAAALEAAGLAHTALGRTWVEAGRMALEADALITLPFREVGYLDPVGAEAVGYRIDLIRGQRLVAEVHLDGPGSVRVFLDLFEMPDETGRADPRRVASADSTGLLTYRIRRSRTYLLRLQSELLRGGRYALTLRTTASVIFPVTGRNSRAIRSFFGASRDGGRRAHHGVDIFAPRGTPVVSATEGYVTRVRNGGLGGKVVWVRGQTDGAHFYYAHLDSQLVRANTRVHAGDTLGLVGNTGNARTTPPHLHLGIYSNGPLDPFPFVHEPEETPPRLRADTTLLGRWTRIAARQASLLRAPSNDASVQATLPQHTALRILAGSNRWYRARLPDGMLGFIDARFVESLQAPLRLAAVASGRVLQAAPNVAAPSIDSLARGVSVPVLARFESYAQVIAPSGRTGWVILD